MYAEKMLLEIVGKRLGDRFDRDAAGVRSDHRAGLAVLFDLGEDLVLDLEIFDHGLDHQVAFLEFSPCRRSKLPTVISDEFAPSI